MTMLEKAASAAMAVCVGLNEEGEPVYLGSHAAKHFVRAVLLAVREPDEAFALTATDGHDNNWGYLADGSPCGPAAAFTAMIGAILEGK